MKPNEEFGKLYAGIDPGLKGAVVVIDEHGNLYHWWDTPLIKQSAVVDSVGRNDKSRVGLFNRSKTDVSNQYDLMEMVFIARSLSVLTRTGMVWIERQQSRPGQAIQSTLKTGIGQGLWEGILSASGVSYKIVDSNSWTRGVGIQKMDKSLGKKRSLTIASNLCPELELSKSKDGRSDAFLIAYWGLKNDIV